MLTQNYCHRNLNLKSIDRTSILIENFRKMQIIEELLEEIFKKFRRKISLEKFRKVMYKSNIISRINLEEFLKVDFSKKKFFSLKNSQK